jgi:peptidoglycan/LPS O-acetylase OafA/YrhL
MEATPKPISDRRIPALDGLRGLAGLMVVFSHYFGEVEHGIHGLMFGWVGVDIFFVLSGYLIGKLILEKQDCANFFSVFYVRRCLRIIPSYMLTLIVCFALLAVVPVAWANNDFPLPPWTYFTSLQVFPMAQTGSVGAYWLSPTWTLAVEEHFYLIIPSLIVFTPRRYLANVLLFCIPLALALRIAVLQFHILPPMSAFVLLPFRMDTLACGLLAAVAVNSGSIPFHRYMLPIRLTPLIALVLTFIARLFSSAAFEIFGPLLMGIGCAAFILCLVLDAPEARRFKSRWLQKIGDNTYCLYLVHDLVLGLMHGLILGTRPDVQTGSQWAVTLASLPVTALVTYLMTRYVEMPITGYGRNWKWSSESRSAKTIAGYAL